MMANDYRENPMTEVEYKGVTFYVDNLGEDYDDHIDIYAEGLYHEVGMMDGDEVTGAGLTDGDTRAIAALAREPGAKQGLHYHWHNDNYDYDSRRRPENGDMGVTFPGTDTSIYDLLDDDYAQRIENDLVSSDRIENDRWSDR